ncbi:MAG: FAD binding domain-containing protein [Lachnospiraceae bacterium]
MFKAKEYVKVRSLEEAYELNQKRSNLIVGGMMWLKMSSNIKITAIDLSGLGLDTIEETDEEFRIGCMCSLRALETHPGLDQAFGGVLKECTRHIVGVQFRNGATVGGSLFGRYGFSDILTCLLALDTYVELYAGGIVSLDEFSRMPYDRDILVRVIIKKDGRKAAYLSQRNTKTDFPVLACCAARSEDQYYISVGARPSRAKLVVIKRTADVSAMAEEAAAQYDFYSNLRGSGEYRKKLAVICLRRLMEQLEGGEA